MIQIDDITKKNLIDLYNKKGIGLEGNITKIIDGENDPEFLKYLKECIDKDTDKRNKRLNLTKKIQKQNEDLTNLNKENERILGELQESLKKKPRRYLFTREDNTPYPNRKQFSNWACRTLSVTLKHPMTLTALRHLYIGYHMKNKTAKELTDMAKKMGHSRSMQRAYEWITSNTTNEVVTSNPTNEVVTSNPTSNQSEQP